MTAALTLRERIEGGRRRRLGGSDSQLHDEKRHVVILAGGAGEGIGGPKDFLNHLLRRTSHALTRGGDKALFLPFFFLFVKRLADSVRVGDENVTALQMALRLAVIRAGKEADDRPIRFEAQRLIAAEDHRWVVASVD